MELKVGDHVVHPKYGVGTVVNSNDREFEPGVMRRYYEVSMPGTTLWISLEMPTFGLRKLTERSEIARCRKILISHPDPLIEDARQRQTEMADRLKQGTIAAHCEVVRDLYAYFAHKPMKGRVGDFLQVAQNVLCQEWAEVEGLTLAEAIYEVSSLLEISRLTLTEAKM
jgi:RNA polymerase-interacting CarD/CdnL/TRCF family regulator